MAREVYSFPVTIPAGTLESAPLTFNLTTPPRAVVEIDVRIPPGPRGLVGFAISAAGAQVLPTNLGEWFIGDNEPLSWPLKSPIDSGAWQLTGWNTGQYDHTLYVVFQVDLPAEGVVTRAQPLPLPGLTQGG